ncbi:Imm10 family immunity protein [Anaeromyxobacter oryzisoli]|uniref:Imm10 family immunity protein n=1 Tax=Anaeromyxobacter oryzisoli TaxID=2925408 RepID=UPI001F59BF38|nr:Imm10 family immunity protein [Anaeromyxobacter sp. SG63]
MGERVARIVRVLEENGVFIVAFGDHPESPERCILLQRTLEPTAADRELGHDRVHLSDESGAGMYGGIVGASLSPEALTLTLTDAAKECFGFAEPLVIDLHSAAYEHSALAEALRRVLQPVEVELR